MDVPCLEKKHGTRVNNSCEENQSQTSATIRGAAH
jgi:hypothetical protein